MHTHTLHPQPSWGQDISGTPQQHGVSLLTPSCYPSLPFFNLWCTRRHSLCKYAVIWGKLCIGNLPEISIQVKVVMDVNSVEQCHRQQAVMWETNTNVQRVMVSVYNRTWSVSLLLYSCSALYHLRYGSGYPNTYVTVRLKPLNLCHNCSHRQGHHVQKSMKVISSKRKLNNLTLLNLINTLTGLNYQRCYYQVSLSNKTDEIITLRSIKVGVAAITKACQIVCEKCYMKDYEVFHHLHTNRYGRGIVLFCQEGLYPSHLSVEIPEGK